MKNNRKLSKMHSWYVNLECKIDTVTELGNKIRFSFSSRSLAHS
jgi:hypothetical protein